MVGSSHKRASSIYLGYLVSLAHIIKIKILFLSTTLSAKSEVLPEYGGDRFSVSSCRPHRSAVATTHFRMKCTFERSPPGNNISTKAFPHRSKHEMPDQKGVCAVFRSSHSAPATGCFLTDWAESGHSLRKQTRPLFGLKRTLSFVICRGYAAKTQGTS